MDAIRQPVIDRSDAPTGLWARLVHGHARVTVHADDEYRFANPPGESVMQLESADRFHAKQGRSTARCLVGDLPDQVSVYLKRHYRFPWWVRFAATLWPGRAWTAARREWQNLLQASSAGVRVPRPVAVGEFIGPFCRLASYLMVAELVGQQALHEYFPHAATVLTPNQFRRHKRDILTQAAQLTKRLHATGLFHKDLYLCHFFIPEGAYRAVDAAGMLTLIDLHRLARHAWLPLRWQIKDLAQWIYSSELAVLNDRDRLWFFRQYLGTGKLKASQKWLWRIVRWRASWYGRHNRTRRGQIERPLARAA